MQTTTCVRAGMDVSNSSGVVTDCVVKGVGGGTAP